MDASIVRLLSERLSEGGDAFAVAKTAGTSAAEETARLILEGGLQAIEKTEVTIKEATHERLSGDRSLVRVEVSLRHRSGCKAEMAVLTAVSAAMLALRDSCKAVGGEIEVMSIRLL
jgi:molybdenum cofactor biosynthesis enzyme